uniref:Cryptochrome-2 n=1 Tax=Magallana gigas TaxID=29159 RepID=K1PGB0_MAGGI
MLLSGSLHKGNPVLKGYPAKYIYEPWTAPESVQRAAKCIIGKDYPVPMVNHAEVSKLNTGRMKQVYQQLAVYASIASVPKQIHSEEPYSKHEKAMHSGNHPSRVAMLENTDRGNHSQMSA